MSEANKIIKSVGTIGIWTAVCRVFGLARDMMMASVFGSTMAMDAYVIAFSIPNLFRGLFGEGALSSAFIPVFTDTLEKQGRAQVWTFARRMLSLLLFVLTLLTLAGLLVTALLMNFFPLSERLLLVARLLLIMLPYMLFICLTAFLSAMLNALRRFALPAAVPVVLNLVILAVLLWVCPHLDPGGTVRIRAVAWGVIVAGLLQAALPLWALARLGFKPRLDCDWSDSRVRRVLHLMAASAIGAGASRFNTFIDRSIALWIGPGSASYLYYAERLIFFPLSVFATALSTVLLPTLSIHATQARPDRMRATLNYAMRLILFITLPAAIGILVLATPIVSAVFERGDFTADTTRMTALALACYTPGLVVFSLVKVLVPVFYAQQDTRTPVKIGIACTALNLALNLILMWPLKHAGIALATVLASTVNVVWLAIMLHMRGGSPGWAAIASAGLRMLGAAGVMALVARLTCMKAVALLALTPLSGSQTQVAALSAAIVVGTLVYMIVAKACGCREVNELLNVMRRRAHSI